MAFYFLLPTLPVFVTKGLGEDTSKVGLIIGVYSLSALLIRPAAGYALDVFGRKPVYIIALVLYTVAMGGYIFASTFTLLLILRFAHGLTWGVITTGGSTIAADLVPEEKRGEGIGYFGLSITLSIALGPLIGLSIMELDNFKELFIAAFAVSFLAMLIALKVKVPKLSSRQKHKIGWSDFYEKKVVPLSLVMMFAAISYGGIISFVALFYQDRAIEYGSLFFLFYSIGVAIFRPIAGKIMDKRGPALLMFPSFMSNSIGLVLLAYSTEPKVFLFSALLMGLGNGVNTYYPNHDHQPRAHPQTRRGQFHLLFCH